MKSIRVVALLLGVFVGDGIALSTAAAQRPSQNALPAAQDTAIAKLVLSNALGKIGNKLADALYTRQLAPWEITLPRTPGWAGMDARIRHMLVARAPTAADDQKQYLRISVKNADDTTRLFSVVIGSTWRCPGNSSTWLMGEREFEVRIARRGRAWEDVTGGDDLDVIADPSVCP